MVRDVCMIKVVFIKTKVIYTKSDEDFELALSWIMTGNVFLKKNYFYEQWKMYFTLHSHIKS